jgi:hypothetical protein
VNYEHAVPDHKSGAVTLTPRLLRTRLFAIPASEATFAVRGFQASDVCIQRQLESVGETFIAGYCAALDNYRPAELALRLDETECTMHGFAYEGAGMALALLDMLTPWNRGRLHAFLNGPGVRHVYMVYVGAGWAMARLRKHVSQPPTHLDPLLGWLAIDGYGFHEGYFNWQSSIDRQILPRRVTSSARNVFDQGLGRSLWFVKSADVDRVTGAIGQFHEARHADLWSGIGLASAYAGAAHQAALEAILQAAGVHRPAVAQGAAFAAKARQRAGNPVPHTEMACHVYCDMTADAAAAITDEALTETREIGTKTAYSVWRERVQSRFARRATVT